MLTAAVTALAAVAHDGMLDRKESTLLLRATMWRSHTHSDQQKKSSIKKYLSSFNNEKSEK